MPKLNVSWNTLKLTPNIDYMSNIRLSTSEIKQDFPLYADIERNPQKVASLPAN